MAQGRSPALVTLSPLGGGGVVGSAGGWSGAGACPSFSAQYVPVPVSSARLALGVLMASLGKEAVMRSGGDGG